MSGDPTMTAPLVSVIIPAYNGARYIGAALYSVFAQSYRPLEVIVVDDGSIDGTARIACAYPEVRFLYQRNQGNAAARNAGIGASSGELIALLDQDDLWLPHKVSRQVERLRAEPEAGYAICRLRAFLEPGTGTTSGLLRERFQSEPSTYTPSTVLIRRATLAHVGYFDTRYTHASDADWHIRAKQAGVRVAVVPEVLVERRIHRSNLSYEVTENSADLMHILREALQRRRAGEL